MDWVNTSAVSSISRLFRNRSELLTGWFTKGGGTGAADCIKGLPEGAKFVAAYAETTPAATNIALVYFHDEWDKVDITKPLPQLEVSFRQHDERVTIFEDFINGLDNTG